MWEPLPAPHPHLTTPAPLILACRRYLTTHQPRMPDCSKDGPGEPHARAWPPSLARGTRNTHGAARETHTLPAFLHSTLLFEGRSVPKVCGGPELPTCWCGSDDGVSGFGRFKNSVCLSKNCCSAKATLTASVRAVQIESSRLQVNFPRVGRARSAGSALWILLTRNGAPLSLRMPCSIAACAHNCLPLYITPGGDAAMQRRWRPLWRRNGAGSIGA